MLAGAHDSNLLPDLINVMFFELLQVDAFYCNGLPSVRTVNHVCLPDETEGPDAYGLNELIGGGTRHPLRLIFYHAT
jgi:hypothetical protein